MQNWKLLSSQTRFKNSKIGGFSRYSVELCTNEQRCEVFDIICAKFVSLKCPIGFGCNKALSIVTKLFIFQFNKPVIVSYDVDKNEWSEEPCEAAKFKQYGSSVKLPKLHIC